MIESITYKPSYWAFDSYAASKEALRLVDNLFKSLKLHQSKKNKLSLRQLKSRRVAFDRCLSDLILRTQLQEERLVYRSLGKSSFNAKDYGVSYTNFTLIIESLKSKGYLIHIDGKRYTEEDFDNPDGTPAPPQWNFVASHFQPTLKLLKLVRKYGLKKKDLKTHFKKDKPKLLVDVRYPSISNGRNKIRGRKVNQKNFIGNETYKQEEADMMLINDLLFNQELDGGSFTGLKRTFNNYTEEDYQWDAGGRLYDIDSEGYQKLSGDERAKMTINGEPVVEIDIEACFFTILSGLVNTPIPNGDPYEIEGIPRAIVKNWMTISLTKGEMLNKWPPGTPKKLREKLSLSKIQTASSVKKAILERYMWLEWASKKAGGWARLQHIESSIMKQTVMDLVNHEIPAYPVHDSVIVPASKASIARETLAYWFEAKTGIVGRVN